MGTLSSVFIVAIHLLVVIQATAPPPRTAVLYAYHERNEIDAGNLAFFIRHAVVLSKYVDYTFIINGDRRSVDFPDLPNVRIIDRDNVCFDFGAWGTGMADLWTRTGGRVATPYTRYLFINNSVRGPFLPAYVESRHGDDYPAWLDAFARRFEQNSKLGAVGPTINCAHHPHVQTATFMMTHESFQAVEGLFFTCVPDATFTSIVQDKEVELSRTLLEGGYAIDSLMLRYQGVDWSTKPACNGALNPTLELANDLLGLHPLEVMFVKFKQNTAAMRNTIELMTHVADGAVPVEQNRYSSVVFEAKYTSDSALGRAMRAYCEGFFQVDKYIAAMKGMYPDFSIPPEHACWSYLCSKPTFPGLATADTVSWARRPRDEDLGSGGVLQPLSEYMYRNGALKPLGDRKVVLWETVEDLPPLCPEACR